MKPIVTFLLLLIPAVAVAQEGTVSYEQTVKFEIELPPEMAHMKDQFPSTRTASKLLLFNESASLMKDVVGEEQSEDIESESEGMSVRIKMERPNEVTYLNFDEAMLIEQRDFLGRTFLITDAAPALEWRLTDEQSEFLGYLCRKALAVRDTVAVEAWFTPEISVPAGPAQYGGLPGLILVLTEDEGRLSYVAKEISLETLAADAIAAPTQGRQVTREEFDAIVDEKMKEMGANRRGAGTFMIRRQE